MLEARGNVSGDLEILDHQVLQKSRIRLQLTLEPVYLFVDLQHFGGVAVMSPARQNSLHNRKKHHH